MLLLAAGRRAAGAHAPRDSPAPFSAAAVNSPGWRRRAAARALATVVDVAAARRAGAAGAARRRLRLAFSRKRAMARNAAPFRLAAPQATPYISDASRTTVSRCKRRWNDLVLLRIDALAPATYSGARRGCERSRLRPDDARGHV